MEKRNEERGAEISSRVVRTRGTAGGRREGHMHVSVAPTYRWVCPCQEPPVLLATYDPSGKLNIKVRDRYWHLHGFGHVHAICPRCGGEHVLDLRLIRTRTASDEPGSGDAS